MASVGRFVAVLLGLLAVIGPSASFSSSEPLDRAFDRGLAHSPDGWVVSGANVLARLDERLQTQRRVDDAIPRVWARRGFVHIGDVDVSGTTLYVPFEQPDFDDGHQAMARYDARTLRFRDATVVDQHANSFVAVDGATGIAYSMDRFGGDSLLRYDVRAGWRRIASLHMDRSLERVRGAAVARNAVWLMTGDRGHEMYRVDLQSGAVADLGSAPPDAGEGEGLDAADVSSGSLHATVFSPGTDSVTLDHFRTTGEGAPQGTSSGTDTSWPPALIYFGILLAVAAVAAVGTVFYRARTTLHPKR